MSQPILGLATAADIPAIAALEYDYYAAEGYPSALFYQALQQWPGGLWVAKQQQQITAYLLLAASNSAGVYWLMSMLVAPAARGQGLGKRLIQQVQSLSTGLQAIRLTVASDNHAAQRLYQQCGFKKIEEIANFFGPGAHRWLLEWRP
jgi:ribosomal-protein-alanine N-acetyltransferase